MLVLRLIGHNTNSMIASEVTEALYVKWKKLRNYTEGGDEQDNAEVVPSAPLLHNREEIDDANNDQKLPEKSEIIDSGSEDLALPPYNETQ